MAEQTLNNPLSGAEVVTAILDRVAAKLRSDCNLNPNSAYDWFRADISIKLDLHDTGAHVKGDYDIHAGETEDFEGEYGSIVTPLEIDPDTPNAVRVETGQPVPTLAKGTDGRMIEKGVRYARGKAK